MALISAAKLGEIRRLDLLASVRHGGLERRLKVYRKTRLRLAGQLDIRGSLRLGCQWAGTPFFAPGYLVVSEGSRLRVNGDFQVFTGLRIVLDESSELTLGSGFINSDCRISCFESISIGDDVAISEGVTIRDSDNHRLEGGSRPVHAPVNVGDHVWLGLRSTVLKGVTIGSGSVVAAGSVVTRDVPERSLVAGTPATVRRTGVSWS